MLYKFAFFTFYLLLMKSECFAHWTVQTVEEDEDDFNKTEILVSEPKKVGDGMSAYIVYKVTTRVRMFKLCCAEKLLYVISNLKFVIELV